MPVYLFTYHTYGSWLPDRRQGYVRRGEGVLPTDEHAARLYRQNMDGDSPVQLDTRLQNVAIETVLTGREKQNYRAHVVATDPTHVHTLVSWGDDRSWQRVREAIKSSLSRALNAARKQRPSLCKNASRKRVKDRAHFDYLVREYLPGHRGVTWNECGGYGGKSAAW